MRENVGPVEQVMRGIAGPSLILLGYRGLGGRHGHWPGLATMMAGAIVVETAITRVCPINAALGIDSSSTQRPRLPGSRWLSVR